MKTQRRKELPRPDYKIPKQINLVARALHKLNTIGGLTKPETRLLRAAGVTKIEGVYAIDPRALAEHFGIAPGIITTQLATGLRMAPANEHAPTNHRISEENIRMGSDRMGTMPRASRRRGTGAGMIIMRQIKDSGGRTG